MPNMKVLVNTLLNSMVSLGQVIVFAIFFFLIFSILGMSLWIGATHYRCRETEHPENGDWTAVASDTELCGVR